MESLRHTMRRAAWATGLAMVCGGVSLVAFAAEDEERLLDEDPAHAAPPSHSFPAQPSYVVPSVGSSANIIGYKPIPASALGAALPPGSGQPAAGSAVTAAQGVVPPAASDQVTTPATGELPVVYQTGIMLGEGMYTLGRDDVIHIDVRNQPEFSGNFIIGYDGRIQYNYIGDLPIAGLTKYEVQQVLEKLLARYIRVPVVTVQILAYNSKVVYVIGEVNQPGKFIMRGDSIKLREAILAAGLPTYQAALSRVHVIKPDLESPVIRKINLKRILYKGKLKDDIDLAAGEIVVVPSTVMSVVNRFLSSLLSPVTRAARVAALTAI